jgi:hypothetical protein
VFSGDVRSMALDEVFGFLANNALTGTLAVQSGDEVKLNLYFREGVLFFPERSRRGTYNLGRILRHTGVLSREGLQSYLRGLSDRKKDLADQEDSPGVKAAKQMQYTEEIQDLFLWGDARFEFRPGPWSAKAEADYKNSRGLIVPVSTLLMDVARRDDERSRIRQSIPSSRVILRSEPGRGGAILQALKDAGVELREDPFRGDHDLDQHLANWGVPHHGVLAAVGMLVESGTLKTLSMEETRERARELLAGEDIATLARFLGHWAEVRGAEGERFALDLEQDLVTSTAFTSGPEENVRLRLTGPKAFTLLRVLISLESAFTVTLHCRGVEKRLTVLPGQMTFRVGERRDPPCVQLVDYLVKQSSLKRKVGQAFKAHPVDERPPLSTLVSPGQYEGALLSKLTDELAEVGFWRRADLELCNRSADAPLVGEGGEVVEVRLEDDVRAKLLEGLGSWAEVFEGVPGEDSLYIPGKKADTKDPAGRFFQRFSLDSNLGELRRKAQATALEFARFVQQGLRRGYLKKPKPLDLSVGIADATAAGNDVHSYRLALAGQTFGYPGFADMVARFKRSTDLPSAHPGLEGDLDGVGLGAVLQALRNHRRTGTLRVLAGRREEELFFHRGNAFLLRIEDGDGDAFVAFFLGDEGADSLEGFGEETAEHGLISEGDMDGEELAALKESFLDVLLWDGSTFAWYPNSLPDEFYDPGTRATKVALNTDMFLLAAIQTMTAWEDVAEVIGGGDAVFEFRTATSKLEAIRDCGHPEILTLVDGRLSFDDLARISGAPRLEVGQVLADLVSEGSLKVEKPLAPEGTARLDAVELPDPVMD